MAVEDELTRRDRARRSLDSVELWLRRIIKLLMTEKFGANYLDATLPNGDPQISKARLEKIRERYNKDPSRYPSLIDATVLEDVIAIVLHPNLYEPIFKHALDQAYPDGEKEARTFLERLQNHRNALSHGGVCSTRMLEQCVCYSNDLIDSFKLLMAKRNMDKRFNVPMFTRFVDNRGNDIRIENSSREEHVAFDLRSKDGRGDLEIGESLVCEVEVDESFPSDAYALNWMTTGVSAQGSRIEIVAALEHVGTHINVVCSLKTKKDWHRMGATDDHLIVMYRVLPPIE